MAIKLEMASLAQISLDGSKFKANLSKHKVINYGRLKKKQGKLTKEIEELIRKAHQSDTDADEAYQEQNGYSIPDEKKKNGKN